MPLPIAEYALIGNTRTAALVGRDGAIDWLCLPRFDSAACFAALLGRPEHGRWLLAPTGEVRQIRRTYRTDSLVLETDFETTTGAVRLIDGMPLEAGRNAVVRVVQGLRGQVTMRLELVIRFDYGHIIPWVRRRDGALVAIAGPEALELRTPVEHHGEGFTTVADFTVTEGQRWPFALSYFASYESPPPPLDPWDVLEATTHEWRNWCRRSTYRGRWPEAVQRSLLTLKALTYAPTGGIVAAPTTSLPEHPGGVRNWDYRYCWLRDATFTLYALLLTGYQEEASAWREWLLRAAAGRPEDLQILYGITGTRRLSESQLDWLPGYQGATPVRVGNAASQQFQLDVYGEVMDMLHVVRRQGLPPDAHVWTLQRALLKFLESAWRQPDEGIWEVRGPRRHFTQSKVMAWVAIDRAVKAVERFGLEGPVERWRQLRTEIHAEICRQGYNAERGAFVQYYGSNRLDASLLLLPLVGFLPPTDPRVRSTVEAIERELSVDGFILRYQPSQEIEGLPEGEGVFLPCSFWLVDNLARLGRRDEAEHLFERLLALRNEVGLLAEEYDPNRQCLLGNFPQALTHVALVNSARNLSSEGGPGEHRGGDDSDSATPL